MDDGKVNLLHYQPGNTVIYLKNKSDMLSHCDSILKWIMSLLRVYVNLRYVYISMNNLKKKL